MSDLDQIFDEKVAPVIEAGAVSIAFDGCHKIYVLQDELEHQLMKSYGYEEDPSDLFRLDVIGHEKALETLRTWYDNSCGLRFINAVKTVQGDPNKGFTTLIGQGDAFNEDGSRWSEEDEE